VVPCTHAQMLLPFAIGNGVTAMALYGILDKSAGGPERLAALNYDVGSFVSVPVVGKVQASFFFFPTCLCLYMHHCPRTYAHYPFRAPSLAHALALALGTCRPLLLSHFIFADGAPSLPPNKCCVLTQSMCVHVALSWSRHVQMLSVPSARPETALVLKNKKKMHLTMLLCTVSLSWVQ